MNETTSGRSGASADSYIGSLISLTSKCEIRYEGVLYNINTEESSIGLRSVRSFGTEGRKKDGPQIPPSDKVYEYILFRGSDIKDLVVKSSPPAQTAPQVPNDPAIIQSHYPRPTSASTTVGAVGSGTIVDMNSLARPQFQGGVPLYQPGGGIGSWGSSPPPPSANGTGLAMPMYWQGYYGPSGGLSHLQQQPMPFRPPPGLPIPPTMQHVPSGAGLSASRQQTAPQNISELSNPFQQPMSSSASAPMPSETNPFQQPTPFSASAPMPSVANPFQQPTSFFASAPMPSVTIPFQQPMSSSVSAPMPSVSTLAPQTAPSLETSSGLTSNKMPSILSTPVVSANLPTVPLSASSSQEISAIVTPISSKPRTIPVSSMSYQTVPQPTPSILGSATAVSSETSLPSLVTPDQLFQPASSSATSIQPLRTHKEVEVAASSSASVSLVSTDARAPLLPLPRPSDQKTTGPIAHSSRVPSRGYGRGRGHGGSRSVTQFTEDFDFTAMNEKFKKDEVWGHLGKNHAPQRDKSVDVEEEDADADYDGKEDEAHSSKFDIKPVYVKDDFFDTISCNSLDQASRNGRTKFSEQLKIDAETFGDFSRHRGGRNGRGMGRRGNYRGGYYGGRGYGGYGGRGRGQMVYARGQ